MVETDEAAITKALAEVGNVFRKYVGVNIDRKQGAGIMFGSKIKKLGDVNLIVQFGNKAGTQSAAIMSFSVNVC